MTRRLLLATLPFALTLRADAAKDAWDMLSDAASALGEGDAPGFLSYFDAHMPGYDKLREDAMALAREWASSSSIDLVSNDGDEGTRTIQADWQLIFAPLDSMDPANLHGIESTRREERVEIRVVKNGKRWRIESFNPEGFFAPPSPK
jgi:hypothetical protein